MVNPGVYHQLQQLFPFPRLWWAAWDNFKAAKKRSKQWQCKMLTSPWLGSLGRIGRNWMRFQAFKLMLPSHAVHQLIVSMIFSGVDNSGFAPPDRVAQLRKCAGVRWFHYVPLLTFWEQLTRVDFESCFLMFPVHALIAGFPKLVV